MLRAKPAEYDAVSAELADLLEQKRLNGTDPLSCRADNVG